MIVFSHPRSGSSQFLNILKRSLSEIHQKEKVFILGEFLNVWNSGTFGLLGPTLIDLCLGKEFPVSSKSLTLNIQAHQLIADHRFAHDMDHEEMCDMIFKEIELEFLDIDSLEEFVCSEITKRIDFYKDLIGLDYIPILKYFLFRPLPVIQLGSDKFEKIYSLIEQDLLKCESVCFYRKDIYGSILSSLIKTYYFDLPSVTVEDSYKKRIETGHNLIKNEMKPLFPQKKQVSEKVFDWTVHPFLMFESFMQNHTVQKISYEEIFSEQGYSIKYKGSPVLLKRFVGDSKIEEEIPMNYAADKESFFTNIDFVKKRYESFIHRFE